MKTHLHLATSDLAGSTEFYSVLLGAEPTKVRSDYVLFVTEQPGLELALQLRAGVEAGSDAHYGVYVESAADVDSAIERLQKAGLVSAIEREETCCYANQTKVWATDPAGRRWEVYTVHQDTEQRGDSVADCVAAAESCCRG